MPNFFDDMSRKANELALEADKKIRITKKQGEIGKIRERIRQQIVFLGNTTYLVHQRGQTLPSDVEAVCKIIDDLHQTIAAMEAEIEAIKQEKMSPRIAPAASSMVRCVSCGEPIPAHATFCPHCGASQVQPQDAAIACPHCGKPISPDARFCEHCGQPVSAVPASTSPVESSDSGEEGVASPEQVSFEHFTGGDAIDDAPHETSHAALRPCPNCAELIPAEAAFCPVCGAVIS